jgi:hypothetical protein
MLDSVIGAVRSVNIGPCFHLDFPDEAELRCRFYPLLPFNCVRAAVRCRTGTFPHRSLELLLAEVGKTIARRPRGGPQARQRQQARERAYICWQAFLSLSEISSQVSSRCALSPKVQKSRFEFEGP